MTPEERAKANFSLAKTATAVSLDWRVTFFFYAALHAANHFLYEDRIPDEVRHKDRENAIEYDAQLRHVFIEYRSLQTLSETARYLPHIPITQEKLEVAEKRARKIFQACGVVLPEG